MKKKLKDITIKEYEKFYERNCKERKNCEHCCLLNLINGCNPRFPNCWIYYKEIFNKRFLNQVIDIDTSVYFDETEKKYLHNLLRPFKGRIVYIVKASATDTKKEYLAIGISSFENGKAEHSIVLPPFDRGTMYLDLEVNKVYSSDLLKPLLKELDLEKE